MPFAGAINSFNRIILILIKSLNTHRFAENILIICNDKTAYK